MPAARSPGGSDVKGGSIDPRDGEYEFFSKRNRESECVFYIDFALFSLTATLADVDDLADPADFLF